MKGRVIIELDLDPAEITQLQRTGFLVYKSGSKLRLEIGGNLIAQNKAAIRFEEVNHEEVNHEQAADPSQSCSPEK